jgi:hypothetical protein
VQRIPRPGVIVVVSDLFGPLEGLPPGWASSARGATT